MASTREKSIVRFDPRVNYVEEKNISFNITRTSTKLLGTQTSSLQQASDSRGRRKRHQYIPRLHRQTTEIPPRTPLESVLQEFVRTSLHHEFSPSTRFSAMEELKSIVQTIFPALTRNLPGLKFLPAVYALGFSHWDSEPKNRVVCYLPIRLPKVEVIPKSCDRVLIQLPLNFPDSINIEPSSLASGPRPECGLLSSTKLYSAVVKLVRRLLLMKLASSLTPDDLHFSPPRRVMEVALKQSEGWVGDIVPCVVIGTGDMLYCCRSFSEEPCCTHGRNPENIASFHQAEQDVIPNNDSSSSSKSSSTSIPSSSRLSTYSSCAIPLEVDDSSRGILSNASNVAEMRIIYENENTTHPTPSPIPTAEPSKTFEDMPVAADVAWYPCNPRSENKVVSSVHKTDCGVRMAAMMVVCKLTRHDWRLLPFRCYDVHTAMLHDAEHHLDHSPRWQRNSLQRCVHSLLSTLRKFAGQRGGGGDLPHFSVSGVNLWSHWTPNQLALVNSALDRLVSSDTALTSLVCRTGNICLEKILSLTPGENLETN